MMAFNSKWKCEKLTVVVHVFQTTQNSVISCPFFAQDVKEMYKVYNARAQLLFFQLNLLFGVVLVVVCLGPI